MICTTSLVITPSNDGMRSTTEHFYSAIELNGSQTMGDKI